MCDATVAEDVLALRCHHGRVEGGSGRVRGLDLAMRCNGMMRTKRAAHRQIAHSSDELTSPTYSKLMGSSMATLCGAV